ncbi:HD domain-containing protein [Amycolatopsis sp. NPDC006131]|uniref:HD domain-containing protein n=1 Tax=Amycolatopsis sp. NPDC006131 TaxID=3156731 RepID=UPI00339F30B0
MTFTLEEARDFARAAHAGQVDKAGRPYHEHVEAVADMLVEHGEEAQIAGLLHDVLEDTELTAEDLRRAGASESVIDAVEAVTRRPGEVYMDFIRRAARHPLGRLVKLADNRHNTERLHNLEPKQAEGMARRYARARKILESTTS